jgi:hypothetical protein
MGRAGRPMLFMFLIITIVRPLNQHLFHIRTIIQIVAKLNPRLSKDAYPSELFGCG